MRGKSSALTAQSDKPRQMQGFSIFVGMDIELAQRAEVVTGDVPYLLLQASSVLSLLGDITTNGYVDREDQRVSAVMDMASRALKSMAETEGEVMAELNRELLTALSEHRKAQMGDKA